MVHISQFMYSMCSVQNVSYIKLLLQICIHTIKDRSSMLMSFFCIFWQRSTLIRSKCNSEHFVTCCFIHFFECEKLNNCTNHLINAFPLLYCLRYDIFTSACVCSYLMKCRVETFVVLCMEKQHKLAKINSHLMNTCCPHKKNVSVSRKLYFITWAWQWHRSSRYCWPADILTLEMSLTITL